jgi:hypothetical protein
MLSVLMLNVVKLSVVAPNAPPSRTLNLLHPHWITVRRLSAENHLPDGHLVEKKTVDQSVCDR